MSGAVRVDSKALGDPRIEYLGKLAGYDRHAALGRLVQLWAYCTERLAYVVTPAAVEAIIGAPADALVRAELAEFVADGVRVKGTKGRIEWLQQLSRSASAGGKARARQRLADGNPTASHSLADGTSSASHSLASPSALTLPLTLPLTRSGDPPNPQGGSRGRPKKPKPNEPTEAELASVRAVLGKLTERTGIAYRGSQEHTRLIVARMRDGASELDLRKVIQYCAVELGWLDKPEMVAFLRPETLFGPKTISRYLDAAISWHAKEFGAERVSQSNADTPEQAERRIFADPQLDEPEWMR